VVYPPTCDPYANRIVSSDFVEYNGDNLSCTGIQNCDTLTVALQKIDNKICSDNFVAQIIQTIANDPVLKAYFCQLVSSCSPTTTTSTTATPTTTTTTSSTSSTTTTTTSSSTSTTTTTTTAGPTTTTTTTTCSTAGLIPLTFGGGILNTETEEFIDFTGGTVEDACNALATYLAGGGVWVWASFPGYVSSFEVGATTLYPSWCTPVLNGVYIDIDNTNFAFTVVDGLISNIVDCSSTTTTTTTTTIACATPTLNSATSDGFGNVTLDYNLNGSTLCTFVIAEYSDYPSFTPFSFGETIDDGCNLTSYILTLNTSSTQYVRVSMFCDGNTLTSNVISVIPGTTTTTTTIP
jgi:hypothetical protein